MRSYRCFEAIAVTQDPPNNCKQSSHRFVMLEFYRRFRKSRATRIHPVVVIARHLFFRALRVPAAASAALEGRPPASRQ